jgi:hypothetical protein
MLGQVQQHRLTLKSIPNLLRFVRDNFSFVWVASVEINKLVAPVGHDPLNILIRINLLKVL